jgi:TolB-like protein/DNA-binding winged helix-turn-helix (wHTH) protein/predicted Zn-dependent protease
MLDSAGTCYTMNPPSSVEICRFDAYEVDLHTRELRKYGHRIRIQEHSLRILCTLLEHPGDLVSREELCRRLWPDGTTVDFENGLNAAVGKLRQSLRDSANKPSYVETVPRLGYRFIGTVAVPAATAPAAQPEAALLPLPRARRWPWYVVAFASLAMAIAAAAYLGIAHVRAGETPHSGTVILVVLPFQNYDRDNGQQYLADGLTEELTTQLARLQPRDLGVIARTTAMQYQPGTKSIAKIGRELRADYLLEGSIRRSADRLRVSAQLIRTADQRHIWAEEFDRVLGDVLTIESEVAGAVADHISIALIPQTRVRLRKSRGVDSKAYDAYLRGRYLLWEQEYSIETLAKAASYFQTAIDADPTYPAPYAALAEYHLVVPQLLHADLAEHLRRAEGLAGEALGKDDTLAEAHMVIAAHATFTRDWRTAEREFRRTLELDPNLVRAKAFYAAYLLAIGRPEAAVVEIRRAQQLDPLSLTLRDRLPRTLYLARHYDETIEECNKRLDLSPNRRGDQAYLALSYVQTGRSEDALRLAKSISPATSAYVYAVLGHREEALRVMKALYPSASQDFSLSYPIALIWAGLGDRQQALDWLDRSNAVHDPAMSDRLLTDPRLDSLRSEPRFHRLIAQMNYPR